VCVCARAQTPTADHPMTTHCDFRTDQGGYNREREGGYNREREGGYNREREGGYNRERETNAGITPVRYTARAHRTCKGPKRQLVVDMEVSFDTIRSLLTLIRSTYKLSLAQKATPERHLKVTSFFFLSAKRQSNSRTTPVGSLRICAGELNPAAI
jgi:hypothetical protein